MWGFIVGRTAKFIANVYIDNTVSDQDKAKKLKKAVGVAISAAQLSVSIATFDPVGTTDAAAGLAVDTTVDTSANYYTS